MDYYASIKGERGYARIFASTPTEAWRAALAWVRESQTPRGRSVVNVLLEYERGIDEDCPGCGAAGGEACPGGSGGCFVSVQEGDIEVSQ